MRSRYSALKGVRIRGVFTVVSSINSPVGESRQVSVGGVA